MSDDRKRKKAFYKGKYGGKKGRYDSDLRPKLKGFIVTCSGLDRSATVEAYRILNEFADKKYGVEDLDQKKDNNDQESEEEDIEASLKDEISTIKANKHKERRFQSVQCKPKNVIFIKTTIEDPAGLALDIFEDLANDANSTGRIRFCCKLIPVVDTCYAKVKDIAETAKPILKDLFDKDGPSFTYCMSWKARCNNSVKRDDVYAELLPYIKEVEGKHEASYTEPDVLINFDVIANVCCLGILHNYQKFGKYNLNSVSNKGENKKSTEQESSSTDEKKEIKDSEEVSQTNIDGQNTVESETAESPKKEIVENITPNENGSSVTVAES